MAKPPIGYGIVRSWGTRHYVVALTSKDRSYYYGRKDDDSTTRGKLTDLLAERPTLEAARSLIEAIKGSVRRFEPLIKEAQAEVDKLRTQQDGEIKWLAKHHK